MKPGLSLASEWRCIEVVNQFEVFEPRDTSVGWPPYRRLGRIRDAAGQHRLVHLTDFGTTREWYAADDTWTEDQVLAYLRMREELAAPEIPPPSEIGVIVPENEGGSLAAGMHVPAGHLNALPRVYMVDERPSGVDLRPLMRGSPPPPAVARGLLIVIGSVLEQVHRWGRSEARLPICPEHLHLDVRITLGGQVEVRPHFHFVPSEDYALHSSEEEALRSVLDRLSDVRSQQERDDLIGSLASRGTDDLASSFAELIHVAEAAWAFPVMPLCRSLVWTEAARDIPPFTDVERSALAEHVQLLLTAGTAASDEDFVLEAPSPSADVLRWQTRPLRR
jgi:hypothetical protein